MIKLLQFIFKNKLTYKIIQYYHPFVKSSIHTTVHSYWPMPLEERQKNGASQSNKSGEREKGSCHYTNQEQREKRRTCNDCRSSSIEETYLMFLATAVQLARRCPKFMIIVRLVIKCLQPFLLIHIQDLVMG